MFALMRYQVFIINLSLWLAMICLLLISDGFINMGRYVPWIMK